MALRDSLLPVAELGSKLAQQFGLHRYTVTIHTRTWPTAVGGVGETPVISPSVTISPTPKVAVLSPVAAQQMGIMMSGGTVEDRLFKITGITPAYVKNGVPGGYTPAQIAPTTANPLVDIAVILLGDDGIAMECSIVGREFDKPFGYTLIVREKHRVI